MGLMYYFFFMYEVPYTIWVFFYVPSLLYVWIHLMYDSTYPFYIIWSIYIEFHMYYYESLLCTPYVYDYCWVLLLYITWSLCI